MPLRIDNISNYEIIRKSDNVVNFRGTISQTQNDSIEISTKKGPSNNQKVGMGLGLIATIVGGILFHKHFNKKSATEAVEQVTQELTQRVKTLVSEGRITQAEADMFNRIHNLEGEEFVRKAYEEIAKSMNLTKYPKLVVSLEDHGRDLGHTGEDITIYIQGYEKLFGKEHAKEEIINALRHELQHFKQDIIIFLQKGEKAHKEAFDEQKHWDIVRKAFFRGEGDTLPEVLNEEWQKYGLPQECREIGLSRKGTDLKYEDIPSFSPEQANAMGKTEDTEFFHMLFQRAYEHDTPIKTIRAMTPCDFEKMHLTPEELARADEYLEGIRQYICSGCFPKEFYKPDGSFNAKKIAERSMKALDIVDTWFHEGYIGNPIEIDARRAGETLRDKFIEFINALKI